MLVASSVCDSADLHPLTCGHHRKGISNYDIMISGLVAKMLQQNNGVRNKITANGLIISIPIPIHGTAIGFIICIPIPIHGTAIGFIICTPIPIHRGLEIKITANGFIICIPIPIHGTAIGFIICIPIPIHGTTIGFIICTPIPIHRGLEIK
ncbi:hypothetical protein CEXT_636821 [Caerostris extrusa]|uniref:Uncharacterized protein n=1 Tax=Caerostris extrusa TaxID=172846 RepID=A0AAV4RQL2_CAEEX|nr:hypothetical protein CEXT_636821 [Caerostris extrusa]